MHDHESHGRPHGHAHPHPHPSPWPPADAPAVVAPKGDAAPPGTPALYFDCVCGAAGDMCLAALVDLGCPLDHVRAELAKLRLPEKYEIRTEVRFANGIRGTRLIVDPADEDSARRNLHDILRLVEDSGLAPAVVERVGKVFGRIGEAEAAVHGVPVEEVHFHEIGAVDSIVDIVGTCIALDYFASDALYSSAMKTGGGFVACRHGLIPVPAPAVLLLARGRTMEYLDVPGELTTPTGAAILAALTEERPRLKLKVEAVGYGCGTRKVRDLPNVLRIVRGVTV